MNFPISLDDLKNWYAGVTNPSHWANAMSQLQQARNSISSATQKITPTGGSPISGPPMTFADVWKRMVATTDGANHGTTQPTNQSGW